MGREQRPLEPAQSSLVWLTGRGRGKGTGCAEPERPGILGILSVPGGADPSVGPLEEEGQKWEERRREDGKGQKAES